MIRTKLFNGPFSAVGYIEWTELALNGPAVNLFYVMNKKLYYAQQ